MKKIFIAIGSLIIVFLLTFTIALDFIAQSKKKLFENEGFKITLTTDFTKDSLVGATIYYKSSNSFIIGYEESFENLRDFKIKKTSSLEDYAKVIMKNNNINYELKRNDEILYFEYESNVDGESYYYFVSFFKSNDSFWVINFVSKENQKNIFKPQFLKWAKSIEV